MAMAVEAIVAVATQPITCIGRGRVKPAMIEPRMVRSIILHQAQKIQALGQLTRGNRLNRAV
jgi:hypothetical protein